ncbi:MAG: DUF6273 domain-containing protein [Fusobacteriaceae bacterium]|jgi:hypothetical protein|nr:DUF6273 domain-containing protein [Fusobacteriaceae bacterium]
MNNDILKKFDSRNKNMPHASDESNADGSNCTVEKTLSNEPRKNKIFTPKIGDSIQFGSYDWRVLDVKNGKALLIAQDITHVNMPYNEEWVDVTWETCTLRKWLNEEFFYSFSAEEQRQIVPTANINENNQWYGINGGRNTQDRIFLLSISEVVKYLGDSGDLKNRKGWYWEGDKWILKDSKGYAINDQFNQKRITKYNGSVAWWWLRSPGYVSNHAAIVDYDGRVNMDGGGVIGASDDGGVRPALWLSLDSDEENTELTTAIDGNLNNDFSQNDISMPSIGDNFHFGAYDWVVLDVKNEKALLIAQDVTHVNMPYNTDWDVTWETCTLRRWLNNDFYHSFSKTEQSRIALTNIKNVDNQWFGTNGGNNTQDKVFLLSIAEVVQYFGDSGQLKNKSLNSDYYISDQFNQKRIAKYNGSEAWWWLRSPGLNSTSAAFVDNDGDVNMNGSRVRNDSGSGGVRPALWLNL